MVTDSRSEVKCHELLQNLQRPKFHLSSVINIAFVSGLLLLLGAFLDFQLASITVALSAVQRKMNLSSICSFIALLSCAICVTEVSAFKVLSARSPWVTALHATARTMAPTAAECGLAYQYWMDLNDVIPPTAPAYLTEADCQKKFMNLVTTVNSVEGALEMLKADPGVLRFKEETVTGSYAAWVRKFEGDDVKTLELCIRAPMILALKPKVIDEIKQSDVAQTIFFSYFAVIFRGPTKLLQMLIKPLFML